MDAYTGERLKRLEDKIDKLIRDLDYLGYMVARIVEKQNKVNESVYSNYDGLMKHVLKVLGIGDGEEEGRGSGDNYPA